AAGVDRDNVEAGEDVDEVAGLKLAGQSAGRVERNRDHPLSIGERTGKRSRRSGEVCRRELLATVDSVAGGATGQTGRVADRALLELALADGLRRVQRLGGYCASRCAPWNRRAGDKDRDRCGLGSDAVAVTRDVDQYERAREHRGQNRNHRRSTPGGNESMS